MDATNYLAGIVGVPYYVFKKSYNLVFKSLKTYLYIPTLEQSLCGRGGPESL